MTVERFSDETVLTWVANDGRVLAVWHVPAEQPRPQNRPAPVLPSHRRPAALPAPQEEMAWRVADVAWIF